MKRGTGQIWPLILHLMQRGNGRLQTRRAFGGDNPKFGQVAAQRVNQHRSLLYQRIPPVGAAYRWFPIWVMVSALIS
jgi:hypothetical protein